MPNSQFSNIATLQSDGRIGVSGTQEVQPPSDASTVRYHFILVQKDVVARGTGQGTDTSWTGTTDPDQPALEPGPVLALGLAVLATSTPSPGFMTFSWSDQIELVAAPG